MKRLLILLIWLMLPAVLSAQEEVVELSTDMFEQHQRLQLATLEGWIFQQGNNPSWVEPEFNPSGWASLRPEQLSAEMEDTSGRLEGWFRISFKLDSSFTGMPLAISRDLWAATDIYLNGKLFPFLWGYRNSLFCL